MLNGCAAARHGQPEAAPSTTKHICDETRLCAMIYSVFILGSPAATARYLVSDADCQEAMARLITVLEEAVVSILTLTRAPRIDRNGRRARGGGRVAAKAYGADSLPAASVHGRRSPQGKIKGLGSRRSLLSGRNRRRRTMSARDLSGWPLDALHASSRPYWPGPSPARGASAPVRVYSGTPADTAQPYIAVARPEVSVTGGTTIRNARSAP
jgi:hypothetical protein